MGLLLIAGWTGCERVTSSLNPKSSLSPDELPKRGTTVLPKIGNSSPEVRVVPPGDNRGKSGSALAGTAPELNLDRAELRAYIESVADIHNERYISLFVVADSTGGFYHYAYRKLHFHHSEDHQSGGNRELYIYVLPNEDDSGILRMNIALLPRTQTAFAGYARWLLPEYKLLDAHGFERVQQGGATAQTAGSWVCYWQSWWQTGGAEGEYGDHYLGDTFMGCYYDSGQEDDWYDDEAGGGGCWSCEEDDDEASGGVNVPTSCGGDPNAYWDPVCPNRCVGGSTDREPATDGMDCDKICDYDSSFLNRMDVQAEIHRMWNASFGPNSSPLPHDQRNEAVTFVEKYTNEPTTFREIEPNTVSSCHWDGRIVFDGNNHRNAIQAILHTHPFSPGDVIMDQRCVDYHNSRLRPGVEPYQLGTLPPYNAYQVSGGDRNTVRDIDKPMYVIDREGIRRINPENPSVYERHFNHCWN